MNPDSQKPTVSSNVPPLSPMVGYIRVGDGSDVPSWQTTPYTYSESAPTVAEDDEITQLADIIEERSKAVMVNAMFREVLERISYMDDEQCVDMAAYLAEEILKRADRLMGDE